MEIALLMHYFTENKSEFKKLEISREEFDTFKGLVLSTITQTISGYHQDQQRKRRALELYDEIYDIPIRNDHQFPKAIGGSASSVFSFVATVNYDLVLEIYGTQTRVAGVPKFYANRGFKGTLGDVPVLDIAGIRQGDRNPDYIKLHGSIDWWQNDSGQIIASLEGQGNPFEILTKRTIIYPIYEKHVTIRGIFIA